MLKNSIRDELQNILSGKNPVGDGNVIKTIANYLRRSQATSKLAQTDKRYKKEETEKLLTFIEQNNLWVKSLSFDSYLSEGAEQRVFIKDDKTVYKLNDTIYYTTWLDYFINLLLNNYFFPDTAYSLKGFYLSDDKILYAFVEQPYVKATQPTNLNQVKEFMLENGFENIRNIDYYNPELGIILEDLHDENVLTQNGILYFIDTVFYIKPEIFWAKG